MKKKLNWECERGEWKRTRPEAVVAFQFHKRYWSSSRVATLAYAANQEQSWINNNNKSNKKNLCAIAIIIALPAHNQNIKQLTKAAQHSTTTLTPSLFISLGARLALLSITPSLALSLSLFLARTQAHKCLISIGIFWRWRCCGDDCEWQRRRSNSSDSSSGSDVSVCCACT